jgi:hypothetical protein
MPFQRLGRLFSSATAIPWLVVLCGTVETIERIEFVAAKTRDLRGFLTTPIGGLSITLTGLLTLFLVVLWPDLKKRCPWLALRKTIHERVHDIEAQCIPKLEQTQEDHGKRISAATEVLEIMTGERTTNDALHRELSERLTVLERKLQVVDAKLTVYRSKNA